MKVIVIGALQNGKDISNYLEKSRNTELLRVYTLIDELGIKTSDFIYFDNEIFKDKLKKVDNINNYADEICNLKPDIIFVVGWSQIIDKKIIDAARIGVIGFHPSKLPMDRGGSVLAWQISEGYKAGCVSMFWIDEGMDSGDIIGQKNFEIENTDTIRNVLNKVYKLCVELTKTYYPLIVKGNLIRIKQDNNLATYRRRRNREDGIIDWNDNSRNIYNLIRAITIPYPGATTSYKGKEITILEADVYDEFIYNKVENGTIVSINYNDGMVVRCKDGTLIIKKLIINNEEVLAHNTQKYFQIGEKLM